MMAPWIPKFVRPPQPEQPPATAAKVSGSSRLQQTVCADLGDGPTEGLLERVSGLQTIETVNGAVGQVEQIPESSGGHQHEMIVVHAAYHMQILSTVCEQLWSHHPDAGTQRLGGGPHDHRVHALVELWTAALDDGADAVAGALMVDERGLRRAAADLHGDRPLVVVDGDLDPFAGSDMLTPPGHQAPVGVMLRTPASRTTRSSEVGMAASTHT